MRSLNEHTQPPYSGPGYLWLDAYGLWKLYDCPCDSWTSEYEHPSLWEAEVAKLVASNYSNQTESLIDKLVGLKINRPQGDLYQKIRKLWYGFPRFRVALKGSPAYRQLAYSGTKLSRNAVVIHGNDASLEFKAEIESKYGISNQCQWVVSKHEKSLTKHKVALQKALMITIDWPSSESMSILQ